MPGITTTNSRVVNPVTSLKTTANAGRGTGSAMDPVMINGVNQLPANAPAKADTATSAKLFQGLMKSLNDFEKSLVPKTFNIANEYSIEFFPAELANAKIVKPGSTNKSATPSLQDNSARNKLPETNAMMKDARIQRFQAGTPIVQIIDQILRNSSYITDQSKVTIDETTGKTKSQVPIGNNVTWFKISVQVTPKEFDEKRQDFAYKIKYLITPYALNNMVSEYFPEGQFKGLHKTYDYWFTGNNTQVLHFEQQFNKLWVQTITDANINLSTAQQVNQREIWSKVYQAASEQSSQGADGKTNEISANAADYLYSVGDQGNIKLKIVGDPAWLQQGEITTAADPKNFTFGPFNFDGTINFDASQVCFSVNWNRPSDYDLNSGIMPVGAKNNGQSGNQADNTQESITYRATSVKSHFSRGKFEQELEGILFLVPPPATGASSATRAQTSSPAAVDTRTPLQAKGQDLLTEYGTNTLKLPPKVVEAAVGSRNPPSAINPAITNSALGFSSSAPYPPATPPTSNGSVLSPAQPGSGISFAEDTRQRQLQNGVIKTPQTGSKEY